jgi:flagellar hook-associated protein 2
LALFWHEALVVSTGVTFSGFNQIDFNVVLGAIMQQESQPLAALQAKQTTLQSRITQFTSLSTKITALQNAATALSSTTTAAASYKATVSDSTALTVAAGSSAVPGRYDIKVLELARAQVTASENAVADSDTTTVATGGSIVIGGKTITLTGATTLKGLSEAINANADSPARASVVQSGTNAFKLVLSAKNTGDANGFTVVDNLTGGAFDLEFTDTNDDGVTGDQDEDNAVNAMDASLLINNIAVTSASNTLDAAIPGSSMTLLKKDPAATITVDISEDPSALKAKLQTFVNTYNDINKFITDQNAAKTDGGIGREPVVRGLRNAMRSVLSQQYTTGSSLTYLAQAGIEITQAGTMQIKDSVFNDAVKNGGAEIAKLFSGTDLAPGALKSMVNTLKQYTQASGFLPSAQTQLTDQISRLGSQVGRMQDRLALRRAALQQEFTAADAAMSRLKSQSGSLSGVSL